MEKKIKELEERIKDLEDFKENLEAIDPVLRYLNNINLEKEQIVKIYDYMIYASNNINEIKSIDYLYEGISSFSRYKFPGNDLEKLCKAFYEKGEFVNIYKKFYL
ncbi:MAG: hypothetical protein SCJ93_07745 [Bacillota bacterium]|nr:hypothetical protein [Bacillota bacterium]